MDIHLYSRFFIGYRLSPIKMSATSAFRLRSCFSFYSNNFYSNNFDLLLVLLALSRSFSRNLPTTGKLQRRLYLSPSRVLTKRDCNHIHGSGQPVLPTLDLSGGSIHSHS